MLDILFAMGQFLSVVALLYGLILIVAHGDCVDTLRRHYDPVTGYPSLRISIVRDDSASRASITAEPLSEGLSATRTPQVS